MKKKTWKQLLAEKLDARLQTLVLALDVSVGWAGSVCANALLLWLFFPNVFDQFHNDWRGLVMYLSSSGMVSAGFYIRKPGHGHMKASEPTDLEKQSDE